MFHFLKKIVSPFSKIKTALGQKIRSLFSQPLDQETLDRLEQLFYEADLGAKNAAVLVETLKAHAKKNPDPNSFLPALKQELLKAFPPCLPQKEPTVPHVILIIGINGSGKTTTIAKLAHFYREQKKSVLIAAADTFRAAALEQLEAWAEKTGAQLVKSKQGSDPSAVVFDALSSAKTKHTEVILIDTAGRLQNKTDLMQELAKIRRTCAKQIPESPHETLLVLDASLGQNALDAARAFHQLTPVTGIVLTKLDGSAKGGAAFAIQKELNIPIVWVGLGEAQEDLVPFDPEQYIDALLGIHP